MEPPARRAALRAPAPTRRMLLRARETAPLTPPRTRLENFRAAPPTLRAAPPAFFATPRIQFPLRRSVDEAFLILLETDDLRRLAVFLTALAERFKLLRAFPRARPMPPWSFARAPAKERPTLPRALFTRLPSHLFPDLMALLAFRTRSPAALRNLRAPLRTRLAASLILRRACPRAFLPRAVAPSKGFLRDFLRGESSRCWGES